MNALKGQTLPPLNATLCKHLQTEGKIKTFTDIRKQKDLITSRLRLKRR